MLNRQKIVTQRCLTGQVNHGVGITEIIRIIMMIIFTNVSIKLTNPLTFFNNLLIGLIPLDNLSDPFGIKKWKKDFV